MITDALIIRENNNVGEADRIITALTRDEGVIRASVRGARRIGSRKAASTHLLSYVRLALIKGRDLYIVEDAEPIRVFPGIREDVELLSLAGYFCELSGVLAPKEEPAGSFLSLMLNALYLLSHEPGHVARSPLVIKAALELRMLSLAGFMPDVTACSVCGAPDAPQFLLLNGGRLLCRSCMLQRGGENHEIAALTEPVLHAVRHILFSEPGKCFSFLLPDQPLHALSETAEKFTLYQIGRGFKTLDIYRSLSAAAPRKEKS